ncbi:MAG: hypothetical protein ACI8W7_004433, partial [Gammaproteobacteria bacterium]
MPDGMRREMEASACMVAQNNELKSCLFAREQQSFQVARDLINLDIDGAT